MARLTRDDVLKKAEALKNWGKVHEAFYGFAASLKDKAFEAV